MNRACQGITFVSDLAIATSFLMKQVAYEATAILTIAQGSLRTPSTQPNKSFTRDSMGTSKPAISFKEVNVIVCFTVLLPNIMC